MSKMDEYLFEKGAIKLSDLVLSEAVHSSICKKITNELDLMCNGYWKEAGKYVFTDKITESTFLASNIKEAREKLEKMRKKFAM